MRDCPLTTHTETLKKSNQTTNNNSSEWIDSPFYEHLKSQLLINFHAFPIQYCANRVKLESMNQSRYFLLENIWVERSILLHTWQFKNTEEMQTDILGAT